MKTQTTFEGTERRIELYPEAAIDSDLSGVIHPGHPKNDLPFRFAESFDQCSI